MTTISEPGILTVIEGKTATIWLKNPPGNTLNRSVLKELDLCLDELLVKTSVKVILISGAGKSFSTGIDVGEIARTNSAAQASETASLGQNIFLKIENYPKPVIAVINGFCLGAGLELAMSCHIRVASDMALIGLPEISLGMIPSFGGTQRLPRLIGKGKAYLMILTGSNVHADEAYSTGLVDLVVPRNDLQATAMRLAVKMTDKSSTALSQAIFSISKGSQTNITEGMKIESNCVGELYNSYDIKEGVAAFLEKRKATFLDR